MRTNFLGSGGEYLVLPLFDLVGQTAVCGAAFFVVCQAFVLAREKRLARHWLRAAGGIIFVLGLSVAEHFVSGRAGGYTGPFVKGGLVGHMVGDILYDAARFWGSLLVLFPSRLMSPRASGRMA